MSGVLAPVHSFIGTKLNGAIVFTVCSVLIFLPSDLPAGEYAGTVVLTDEQRCYPLGLNIGFFEDTARTLTIEDISSSEYADRFTPGFEEVTNLGINYTVYWIRISVKNETRDIDDWRLRVENSYFDLVDVYFSAGNGPESSFILKRSGDAVPFHEWDTNHRQFVFKITIPPGAARTLYVRIENEDGIITRISLWPTGAFAEQTAQEQLWYGVYFGSMLIMACYNLFIYFSLRDKSYLCYVLFVLSWGLKEFCANGFAYQYLWPDLPRWNEPISLLLGTLSAFFALLFTAQFLKLSVFHPRLGKSATILCAGWIASFAATLVTGLGNTSVFIQLLTLASLVFILIAPIISWRGGYNPARYLLLAWTAFAATGSASVLTTLGILPSNSILLYSYPFGVVLLMLLLSWALADRINELKTRAEQKRLRALELQQAKNLAEASNQAKSVFLANMSHELRTPLNAILGFAGVVSRSPNIPPEEQGNLGIIRRSGEHLMTLINQVLDLSKIEAGRITLNEEDFDLHQSVNEIYGMFVLKAESKNVRLLVEMDGSVPQHVRADEVKLRQVLINLLGNAVKFTEEGEIRLSVASEQLRQTEKTMHDCRLLFSVKDTGSGIAPDEIEKVFESFAQTASGIHASEGTGLGLPIARRFVRLMGGDVHVESREGRGTGFEFDIPVRVSDASETTPEPARRAIALEPDQPRHRMLIVDDSRYNRQLLLKLLGPFGFDLREAVNGKEAVEIWESWSPHLIFMDIRMPVTDGYEATKKIRRLETEKSGLKTIIVAVTASSFEEERAEVLSAGCDDFLRKPFTDEEIFEVLRKHLGVRFVYEKEPGNEEDTGAATSEALAALPGEWLEILRQSAFRADFILLSNVIEQIRGRDAALADALAGLAEEFEYDEILALIP